MHSEFMKLNDVTEHKILTKIASIYIHINVLHTFYHAMWENGKNYFILKLYFKMYIQEDNKESNLEQT